MSPTPPPDEHDALPAGTRFGELEIVRVLGVGGFGIVYLARDHALERDVALKEYMPASLAARGDDAQITVRSQSYAETYAVGLRSFVNEARLLAKFDHPSMVKVYRFWEGNGTAYMVMPYLQGRTLRDVRRTMAVPPDERWIRGVLDPVLAALERLHHEGVFHRDIAPDNILLPDDAAPILLDFGAARRVISDRTQSLTAILKPSYAPIEQYAEMASLRQGPWTDVYAVGAVIHFLLFGNPPAPSTARAVQDDLADLPGRRVTGVSPRFLSALAWSLAVRPQDRPQSIAAFRAALEGSAAIPVTTPDSLTQPPRVAAPASAYSTTVRMDQAGTEPPRAGQYAGPGSDETIVQPRTQQPRAAPPSPAAAASAAPARSTPAGLLVAGIVGLVVLGGGFAWWLSTGSRTPVADASPAAAPATQAAATTAPPAAPPAAPPSVAPAPSPAAPSPPAPAPPTVATPTPAAAPAPAPAAPAGTTAAAGTTATAPVTGPAPTTTGTSADERPAAKASPAQVPVAAKAPPAHDDERSGTLLPRPVRSQPVAPTPVPAPAVAVTLPAPTPQTTQATPAPSATPVRPSLAEAPPTATATVPAGTAAREPERREAAAPPISKGPVSATQACGSRVLIALALCMDRECKKPEFAGGADCVRYLDEKRRRDMARGVTN